MNSLSEQNNMSSQSMDNCTLTSLPCELHSMIFAGISDDPASIRALAKTCKVLYATYIRDKEFRLRKAIELMEGTIGFGNPTSIRLCLMYVRFQAEANQISTRAIILAANRAAAAPLDYKNYSTENWEFSADDYAVAKSVLFAAALRTLHEGAQLFLRGTSLHMNFGGAQPTTTTAASSPSSPSSSSPSSSSSGDSRKEPVTARWFEFYVSCMIWYFFFLRAKDERGDVDGTTFYMNFAWTPEQGVDPEEQEKEERTYRFRVGVVTRIFKHNSQRPVRRSRVMFQRDIERLHEQFGRSMTPF